MKALRAPTPSMCGCFRVVDFAMLLQSSAVRCSRAAGGERGVREGVIAAG